MDRVYGRVQYYGLLFCVTVEMFQFYNGDRLHSKNALWKVLHLLHSESLCHYQEPLYHQQARGLATWLWASHRFWSQLNRFACGAVHYAKTDHTWGTQDSLLCICDVVEDAAHILGDRSFCVGLPRDLAKLNTTDSEAINWLETTNCPPAPQPCSYTIAIHKIQWCMSAYLLMFCIVFLSFI